VEQRRREDMTEEERFAADLVARGQAAEPDEDGNLPPGATHAILEHRADGTYVVERRRFSA